MATQIERPRIRPLWRAGLRRGRERNTMTAYMAAHPEFVQEMHLVHRQLEAWGVQPMSMEGVKQPFEFDSRRTGDPTSA